MHPNQSYNPLSDEQRQAIGRGIRDCACSSKGLCGAHAAMEAEYEKVHMGKRPVMMHGEYARAAEVMELIRARKTNRLLKIYVVITTLILIALLWILGIVCIDRLTWKF